MKKRFKNILGLILPAAALSIPVLGVALTSCGSTSKPTPPTPEEKSLKIGLISSEDFNSLNSEVSSGTFKFDDFQDKGGFTIDDLASKEIIIDVSNDPSHKNFKVNHNWTVENGFQNVMYFVLFDTNTNESIVNIEDIKQDHSNNPYIWAKDLQFNVWVDTQYKNLFDESSITSEEANKVFISNTVWAFNKGIFNFQENRITFNNSAFTTAETKFVYHFEISNIPNSDTISFDLNCNAKRSA